MCDSETASTKKEENIHKLASQICGLRRIDTRALGRIISWSIANCERQTMILKSALNILSDEIRESREKNR